MSEALTPPPSSRPHEYVVVARRYRPQNFQQLVGQDQVSQALGNAITTQRVGHAYLFTGARGVGKTSTARIFSKCLNCVTGPTTTPCGECDVCRSVATGEDVDVIEIDGASNRGIDEIRQLRSNVNVRPSRARFKIYIIDEVHMLTTAAFNALLKTLEEPPEHVKFIFCTTEADKIPITVLSRCQRFDFAPIETKSILDRLAAICANEGVTAETEALQILARRAAGSMRDSQSLLEQLLSFGGKELTADEVHSLLGTAKSARLFQLAELLTVRDAAGALRELDAAVQDGVDLGQLLEQLVGLLRDVMAAHVGCSPDLFLHTAPSDGARLADLGTRLGLETTLAMVQILDHALVRMRQSTHVRTLAEVALVRACKLEDLDALAGLVAAVKAGTPLPAMSSPAAAATTSVQKKTADLTPAPSSSGYSSPSQPTNQQPLPVVQAESEAPAPTLSSAPALTLPQAQAAWQQAVREMEDLTGQMAAMAESVAIFGPNRLVAQFRPQYTLQKETCERPDRRQKLVTALGRILGFPVTLDFALLAANPEAATNPAAGTTGGPINRSASPPPESAQARKQRQRELERHPWVRQAMELFDAEVVHIAEGAPRIETERAAEETG